MSIDFGVLRDGSTITLNGQLRASPDEDVFDDLLPLWRRIEKCTGESLDKYEGATFSRDSLDQLIAELQSHLDAADAGLASSLFIADLLRIACAARDMGKPLSYFGL